MATSAKPIVKIDWSQLDELKRDLSAVANDLDDRDDRELAETLAAVARGLAPKLSGALAASIKVGSNRKGSLIEAGAGLDGDYAAVQEFGWMTHNIAPSRYMSGAIEQVKPEQKIEDAIWQKMRRAFPTIT